MTPKSFWSYQNSTPTPSLEEALEIGAIASNTSQKDWDKITPGMKIEIVRSKKKENGRISAKSQTSVP